MQRDKTGSSGGGEKYEYFNDFKSLIYNLKHETLLLRLLNNPSIFLSRFTMARVLNSGVKLTFVCGGQFFCLCVIPNAIALHTEHIFIKRTNQTVNCVLNCGVNLKGNNRSVRKVPTSM